jgi:YVTN family beta-propeller protein
MHIARRLLLLFLAFNFVVLTLPVFGQRVIATLPVGQGPLSAAINSGTNKIYVADWCGNSPNCTSGGTVTVIDGSTDNTLSVNVGFSPYGVAVNPVTNKIYVANRCGNTIACTNGSVSVIDGASNTVIATPLTGTKPFDIKVDTVTNRIYVPNNCGNDASCHTRNGTVTVIDGASDTVIATVNVGAAPAQAAVNSVTNKIYVSNSCGSDPLCVFPYTTQGTVTIIDGVTNNTVSVNVGIFPSALDVNSATNKIYVANQCGNDPACGGTATMTVIDGATLGTIDIAIGGHHPQAIAVNSVTNKIYVPSDCYGDPSCQNEPNGTVSVVDGATLAYTSVGAGVPPTAWRSIR